MTASKDAVDLAASVNALLNAHAKYVKASNEVLACADFVRSFMGGEVTLDEVDQNRLAVLKRDRPVSKEVEDSLESLLHLLRQKGLAR